MLPNVKFVVSRRRKTFHVECKETSDVKVSYVTLYYKENTKIADNLFMDCAIH